MSNRAPPTAKKVRWDPGLGPSTPGPSTTAPSGAEVVPAIDVPKPLRTSQTPATKNGSALVPSSARPILPPIKTKLPIPGSSASYPVTPHVSANASLKGSDSSGSPATSRLKQAPAQAGATVYVSTQPAAGVYVSTQPPTPSSARFGEAQQSKATSQTSMKYISAGYPNAPSSAQPSSSRSRHPNEPPLSSDREASRVAYVNAKIPLVPPTRPQAHSRRPSDPGALSDREAHRSGYVSAGIIPEKPVHKPRLVDPSSGVEDSNANGVKKTAMSLVKSAVSYIRDPPTVARPSQKRLSYVPVYTGPVPPSSETEASPTRSRRRSYSTGTNYLSDSASYQYRRPSSPIRFPVSPRPIPGSGTQIYLDPSSDVYLGLNNVAHYALQFEGELYVSAENLYQALKFYPNPEIMHEIRNAESPITRAMDFRAYVRPDWPHIRMQTMEDVVTRKFEQHRALRQDLMRTGFAHLLYVVPDGFWGIGENEDGQNEYGKLLMRLREKYRMRGLGLDRD